MTVEAFREAAAAVDPEKLTEVFKMLEALAPTETFKTMLQTVSAAVAGGTTLEQIYCMMGLSAVSTLLETQRSAVTHLEAQMKATKSLALEVELLRECVDGVKAAIFDHTTQAFHATR